MSTRIIIYLISRWGRRDSCIVKQRIGSNILSEIILYFVWFCSIFFGITLCKSDLSCSLSLSPNLKDTINEANLQTKKLPPGIFQKNVRPRWWWFRQKRRHASSVVKEVKGDSDGRGWLGSRRFMASRSDPLLILLESHDFADFRLLLLRAALLASLGVLRRWS